MTIGANLNGGSLTIGANNVSVNIPSGTINAKYFTLRQTTYGNATNTFLIDTTQKTTFTTQMGIADTNAEEVYIGNGAQLKKLILANVATTVASEIKIGNSNSTTNLKGNTNIGTQDVSSLYLRGEFVVLNDTGGTVNIGGVSSGTINLYRPLTVGYTPTFTSSNQIGWNNVQDTNIVNTVYYGGNRTWLWWGESGVSPLYPGIYMVCYTSYTNRTTNYTQSFVYKTLTKPTYALDVTGFTSVNESNFEFPSGYTGGFKMCGSGIAYIPSYNYYIGICQNVFATGSPNGTVYSAATIIRIA